MTELKTIDHLDIALANAERAVQDMRYGNVDVDTWLSAIQRVRSMLLHEKHSDYTDKHKVVISFGLLRYLIQK